MSAESKSMSPLYEVWLPKEDLKPRIAKTTYTNKHRTEEKEYVSKNWEFLQQRNPNSFNGDKAIFYTKEGKDSGILKVVKSDYANVSAALQKDKPTNIQLRQHFVSGVAIVAITSDDMIIVGSRDTTRDKNDPTKYLAQFPCGFLDITDNFYERIATPEGFKEVVIENGLKEFEEELLECGKCGVTITEPTFVGGIIKRQTWPSKSEESKEKQILNFKTFVVSVRLNKTFEEICNLRKNNPPQDFNEMTVLGAIPLTDINKNPPKVKLENQDRTFAGDLPFVFQVLQAAASKTPSMSL
jgi:hypothetical protein